MELNADFLQLQGILNSLLQNIGQFTGIKTKSGYEEEFSEIMSELSSYFRAKGYLINDQIDENSSENLLKIVRFLTVNTEYKNPLKSVDKITHLRGIIPQLSVCILVNIISEFELDKLFCKVLKEGLLSVENINEVLHEVNSCLRKCKPKKKLRKTMIYLNFVSDLIISENTLTDWQRINETSKAMMHELGRFSVDDVRQWNRADFSSMMGFTSLNLFKLLLRCNKHNQLLKQFIDNLIASIVFVLRSLTLDIYCDWMEVEKDGKPLQTLVSELAYRVTTNYANYEPANELLSMLSTIARKPKTITEQIQEASVPTIIENIYKNDENQLKWFQSLIYANLSLSDPEIVKCIGDHAHLCDIANTHKILSTFVLDKARNQNQIDKQVTDVVLKCVAALSVSDFMQLAVQHFYSNGLVALDASNAQAKFTELVNRLTSLDDVNDLKSVLILIISDPKSILKQMFICCLRNSFYISLFRNLFAQMRKIFVIENIGWQLLDEICTEFDQGELDTNSNNFVRLFDTLTAETDSLSIDAIFKLIYNQLIRGYVDKKWQTVLSWLRILKALKSDVFISNQTKSLFELVLTLMKDNRCQFLQFNAIYMEITTECVDILHNRIKSDFNSLEILDSCDISDRFVNYYVTCLKSNMAHCFLENICEDFDANRHSLAVMKLIENLPLCVKCEWQLIGREILRNSDFDKLLELMTDALILLSSLVSNQESLDSDLTQLSAALKYCLENYAFVVQDLHAQNDSLTADQQVCRQICRLLSKLPNNCKEEFGLLLIGGGLMTERALKSLAEDKNFVTVVAKIGNVKICKLLAQKMLG